MKNNLVHLSSEQKTPTLALLLLVLLIPYFIICLYISPSGDDYSYAWTGANKIGFLKTLVDEWYFWNGRYLSNILVLKNPIGFGNFFFYQLIPVVIISLLIFSHYYFVKKTTQLSAFKSILVSLCIITFYLNCIPEIGEGIYWYTAAVTYSASLILFPIYILILLKKEPSTWHVLILILLQFILNGFNEITMLILCIVQGGSFLFERFRKNRIYYLLFLTQLLFASIVFFAPGNEVRGAYFPEKHDVFKTITLGGAHVVRFTALLLLNPFLWITILIFFKHKLREYFPKTDYPLMAWIILFLLPQFIANAGPIWTTGLLGQHRTVNLGIYFQAIVLFSYLMIQKENILIRFIEWMAKNTSFSIIIISTVICIVSYGNSNKVIVDLLSGDAKLFKQENIKRHQLLTSYTDLKDTIIEIPGYKVKPESIYIYDINDDPKDWKNEVYTTFFNLKQQKVWIKKQANLTDTIK